MQINNVQIDLLKNSTFIASRSTKLITFLGCVECFKMFKRWIGVKKFREIQQKYLNCEIKEIKTFDELFVAVYNLDNFILTFEKGGSFLTTFYGSISIQAIQSRLDLYRGFKSNLEKQLNLMIQSSK